MAQNQNEGERIAKVIARAGLASRREAEAWIDGQEDRAVRLRRGDTIALPPHTPHAFRVVGDQALRLLGTHASPKRIVSYKDGAGSDARGYRVQR